MKEYIEKSEVISNNDGLEYKLEVVSQGINRFLRVHSKKIDTNVWGVTSLNIGVIDYFKQLCSNSWPPQNLTSSKYEDDKLVIEFHDPWIPHQKPILPFKLDHEWKWKAEYDSRKSKWKLKKLEFIPYV